jgi:release factor glutamine methyltransferase
MQEIFNLRYNQSFAVRLLHEIGIESALLDTQLLLALATNKNRLELQLSQNTLIDEIQLKYFFALIKRRLCREPIAYILGEKEFYGLAFTLDKNCLIPRPDTESVVEKCLSLIPADSQDVVFDLCTGSGAIGISLLHHRQKIKVIASDISPQALKIAKLNASKLNVADRFTARQGDLFDAFKHNEKASLIVANPPYISTQEINNLNPDVRDFEPHLALNGGREKGLDFYRKILKEAIYFLRDQGYLVLEIGFNQKQDIKELIPPTLTLVEFFKDLGNHMRGVILKKKS